MTDIGGEISMYLEGTSMDNSISAFKVSNNRILSEIKSINPFFILKESLLKILHQEREIKVLKNSLAWKVYSVGSIKDVLYFTYTSSTQNENYFVISVTPGTEHELIKLFPNARNDGIGDNGDQEIVVYHTMETKIGDPDQFLKDLLKIVTYMGRQHIALREEIHTDNAMTKWHSRRITL